MSPALNAKEDAVRQEVFEVSVAWHEGRKKYKRGGFSNRFKPQSEPACEFWTRLAKWLSEVLFHNQQIYHKLKHKIHKTVTEGSGTVSRRDNLGIRMIAIMYVLPGRA